MKVGEIIIQEGDMISIDGNTGEVYEGVIPTVIPDIKDHYLIK